MMRFGSPWPRATVAHEAALAQIKKAGKARHARVDNATPRALRTAHTRIHAEGLERRRRKEEEARHAEDPWIQRRLRQAARVGSSGVRPGDEPSTSPSAEWRAAADAAAHGGPYQCGGAHDEVKKVKGRAVSAGPARPNASGGDASVAGSKLRAAWDSSFSPPSKSGFTPPAKAARTTMGRATSAGPGGRAQPSRLFMPGGGGALAESAKPTRLLPGGGGALVENPAARDLRAGGHAEEHKAARRRKEAAAIAEQNRRTYERIMAAKSHYPKSDAAAHAAKHRAVLEMHHEARGDLPDMTSDLTKEPQSVFVSFGMGAYTLHDKKHSLVGGGGGPVPAPWHRTVGGDVKERYVEYVAPGLAVRLQFGDPPVGGVVESVWFGFLKPIEAVM